jgi:hypothetical protein
VPDPQVVTNHAITIDAPREVVWPWLVQMSWHRAGWYTARWVDKLLFPANWPSANRFIPGLQEINLGDFIPDGASKTKCGSSLSASSRSGLSTPFDFPSTGKLAREAQSNAWLVVGFRTHSHRRWPADPLPISLLMVTAPWRFTLGGWLFHCSCWLCDFGACFEASSGEPSRWAPRMVLHWWLTLNAPAGVKDAIAVGITMLGIAMWG